MYITALCMEDSHTRAWLAVKEFIEGNLLVMPSKIEHAENTLMPNCKTWIRKSFEDMGAASPEDHTLFLWLNAPTCGILSSDRYDFFLTFITNILSDYPKNSVCIIVHPNRASQLRTAV